MLIDILSTTNFQIQQHFYIKYKENNALLYLKNIYINGHAMLYFVKYKYGCKHILVSEQTHQK